MLWFLLSTLTLIAFSLAWLGKKRRTPLDCKATPLLSVGYNPFLGHLKLMLSEQADAPKKRLAPFALQYRETLQPVFDVALGPAILGKRLTFINDSRLAEKVLKSQDCGQHPSLASAAAYTIGRATLPALQGEHWRRHRRYLQPVFRRDCLVKFALAAICNHTRIALDKVQAKVASRGGICTLEVQQLMADLMIDITAEILFGYDITEQHSTETRQLIRESFGTIMECLGEIFFTSSLRLWRLFRWKKDRQLQKARSVIADQVLRPILKHRREALANGETVPSDLLSLFVSDDKEMSDGNPPLTEQEMIDELMGLYMGGYDTTMATICWALYLLAQDRSAQEKLREEVSSVLGPKGFDDEFTMAMYEKMEFTQCVVKETLRLIPTAPLMGRGPTKDIVIDGYLFPKGRPIFVHVQNIHLSPDEYVDAKEFKPTRWFKPGGGCKRSAGFSFLAFGAGNRRCVANHLAKPIVGVVVAMITHQLSFKLATPPDDVEAVYRTIWTPKRLDLTFTLPS